MLQTVIPQGYAPCLNLYDTQNGHWPAQGACLRIRWAARCTCAGSPPPLFVEASTGLNDDLNGVERAVSFDIPDAGRDAQVVHSLAKWKRMALYHYHVPRGGRGWSPR